MPNYGDKKYWDNRYALKETVFDWLEDYTSLQQLITKFIKPDDRILMLGCGNSPLSEAMYDCGFRNIVNMDISKVVIDQMRERNKDRKEMTWEVEDALHMSYKDQSFDIVLDKSTLDAILCGEASFKNAARLLAESQRVLKAGGIYLCISYGRPETRVFHFRRRHLDLNLSCFVLGRLKRKQIR